MGDDVTTHGDKLKEKGKHIERERDREGEREGDREWGISTSNAFLLGLKCNVTT